MWRSSARSTAECRPSRSGASPTPTARHSRPGRWRSTRRRSGRACPSTTPRSIRSAVGRRPSRRLSRWPGRGISPAARRSAGSSTRAGAAITATRSAPSTCPAGGRSVVRTRAGSAASVTSRRPTRIAAATRTPRRSRPPTSSWPSWIGRSRRPSPGRWRRSSRNRSSGRPSARRSLPTATGPGSPRCADAMACS